MKNEYKLIIEIDLENITPEASLKASKLLKQVQYYLENNMINTQAIRPIEGFKESGDMLIKQGEWRVNKI